MHTVSLKSAFIKFPLSITLEKMKTREAALYEIRLKKLHFSPFLTFPDHGSSPGLWARLSGGVKAGVPAVLVRKASLPSNSSETPKSAILTRPSLAVQRRRLDGLMSRWIIFW